MPKTVTRSRVSRVRRAPRPWRPVIEPAPVTPPLVAPVNIFTQTEDYTRRIDREFKYYRQFVSDTVSAPFLSSYCGPPVPSYERGVYHVFVRPEVDEGASRAGYATLHVVNAAHWELVRVSVPPTPHVQAVIAAKLVEALDILDPVHGPSQRP